MRGTRLGLGFGASQFVSGGGGSYPIPAADLIAWYDTTDASTITETSGEVSGLDDKGPNGYHLEQSTASLRPNTGVTINGLAALHYDGGDDLRSGTLSHAILDSDDFIFSIAIEPDNTGSKRYLQYGTSPAHDLLAFTVGTFGPDAKNLLTGTASTAPQIMTVHVADTNVLWRVNGVQGDTGVLTSMGAMNLIEIILCGNSTRMTGSIGEGLFYKGSSNISTVETHLAGWTP